MIGAVVAAVGLAAPPSREALIERWLQANRAHVRATLAGSARFAPPPPDLDALAKRELAVPGRYVTARPTAPQTQGKPWWLPAWERARDWWRKLWQTVFARAHLGRRAAIGIGDVLIALAVLLLLIAGWRLVAQLRFEHRARPRKTQALPPPPDARAFYRRACDAAGRGEYGTASSLLFGATIAALDLQGLAASNRSATVGDLRGALRARSSALIGPFDAIASPFVTYAYAERPVEKGAWEGARAAFASILAEAPQP